MAKLIWLELDRIRADADTQSRAELDPVTVAEYAELLGRGKEPPPGVVFHDGSNYWLADGWHREASHRRHGSKSMLVEVRQGGMREARLYAAGANTGHGLKRSPADKRKAIWIVLNDEEGKTWDDERVAEHCDVDPRTVRACRLSTPWEQPAGLFGADELAKPPPPDLARQEEYARDDEEKARERARRAGRKYLRFTQRDLGLAWEDAVAYLRELADDMEESERRGKKKAG